MLGHSDVSVFKNHINFTTRCFHTLVLQGFDALIIWNVSTLVFKYLFQHSEDPVPLKASSSKSQYFWYLNNLSTGTLVLLCYTLLF